MEHPDTPDRPKPLKLECLPGDSGGHDDDLVEHGEITADARLLMPACGEGWLARRLAERTGCEVVGIDDDEASLDRARTASRGAPRPRVSFHKASLTALPFADASFSHVWWHEAPLPSSASEPCLREIYRVLQDRGFLLLHARFAPSPPRRPGESTARAPARQGPARQGPARQEEAGLDEHLRFCTEFLCRTGLLVLGWTNLEGRWLLRCQKVADWLSWICDSKSADELQARYDAWACVYDANVVDAWRLVPEAAARVLERAVPDKQAELLDAGAGTGLVGEALARLGYARITAADLSAGMLAEAGKKQVYELLRQCDLNDPDAFARARPFDAVISVGVFARAHAGVQALNNLFGCLKPGGVLVVTLRSEAREAMRGSLEGLPWRLLECVSLPVYDHEVIEILAFRKT